MNDDNILGRIDFNLFKNNNEKIDKWKNLDYKLSGINFIYLKDEEKENNDG